MEADPGDGLSPTQAGFVAAVVLLQSAPAVADVLADGDGDGAACAAALATLASLDPAQRSARLTALVAATDAPVPAGLEGIHDGWLRETLQAESSPTLRAIAPGMPAVVARAISEILDARDESTIPSDEAVAEPMAVELRRAIFAPLVPMPAAVEPVSLDPLAREGAELLGRSLQGAPRAVIARAAARVGEPWARVVIEVAARRDEGAGREDARRLVASVDARDTALGAVTAIGVYALAIRLRAASDDLALAVAQQLPPVLGRVLIRVRNRARGAD